MTCVELLALVSDYLDGTIAPDARAILERHASDCDPCLALIETTRATIRVCLEAPGPALDAERRAALLQELERACRERLEKPSRPL